jgi:soluble lytic murein transglycosylase-like protein
MPWHRMLAVAAIAAATLIPSTVAAAAPSTPAPPPATRTVRYTVRAGESFSAIGARFGISARELARANGLRVTSVVHPGRVLLVPVQLPAGLPAHLPADLAAQVDRLLLYPLFVKAAKEANVPADLLMATAYVESRWMQSAVSATGAIGIGQLRPETAAWVAAVLLRQGGLDPTRPGDNLRLSARFLRYLLDTMPDIRAALAAYYQGPGSVTREGITATGRAYAAKILAVRPAFS